MTSVLPLRLDPTAPGGVADQIQGQMIELIAGGTLPPTTRLPPVRTLAGDLGVAPGTVAKAYRLLEQEGYVVTAGRLGTVVADQRGAGAADQEPREQLRAVVEPLLAAGRSPADVLRLVRSVLPPP